MKTKAIIVRVEPELKEKFLLKCAEERRSESNQLRVLLEDFVGKESMQDEVNKSLCRLLAAEISIEESLHEIMEIFADRHAKTS